MKNLLINNETNIIENIIELSGETITRAQLNEAIQSITEAQNSLNIGLNLEIKVPQNTYIVPEGYRIEQSEFGIIGKTLAESSEAA